MTDQIKGKLPRFYITIPAFLPHFEQLHFHGSLTLTCMQIPLTMAGLLKKTVQGLNFYSVIVKIAMEELSIGESEPKGLITGKKAYIGISSGGVYSEGPMQSYDFVTPYMKSIVAFIGITDVTVVRVEGTSIPMLKNAALEKGINSIAV